MAPKYKIVSKKRRAAGPPPTTPPSPPRPQITRERPNSELARRDIIFEKVFPSDDMKKRPECQWTIDYLEKNNMMSITMPETLEIYPRLVRLFYQNMTLGPGPESPENFFEFTIDGHHGKITIADMGQIMNLPHVFDQRATPYLSPALTFRYDYTTYNKIYEDFSVDKAKGSGESIYVSSLPENLWLLDRIFRENIYPLGHHSERRTEPLWALYSAYKGNFYSIPKLVVTCIWKMRSEILGMTPTGKAKPLPFGYLITSILRHTGYPFDDREPQMDVDMDFPLSRWISSYSKMITAKGKRGKEIEKKAAAATSSRPTPSTAPETTRARPSRATTSDVESRLTRMEARQEEMHFMMMAMARHTLGDGYEEIVSAERDRAQRGKTVAEEDSDDDAAEGESADEDAAEGESADEDDSTDSDEE